MLLTCSGAAARARRGPVGPAISPAARIPVGRAIFPRRLKAASLLEDAVSAHLIADVPVGLFLSKRLDSGAIAALASRHERNQSFTLTFPGTRFDEHELAQWQRSDSKPGTRSTLSGEAVLARLDEALGALDQPTWTDQTRTSFPGLQGSWVKVALSGLGGDERFRAIRLLPIRRA